MPPLHPSFAHPIQVHVTQARIEFLIMAIKANPILEAAKGARRRQRQRGPGEGIGS